MESRRVGLARFGLAISITLMLWACAAKPPVELSPQSSHPSWDRRLGHLIEKGRFDQALAIADSLHASKNRTDREVAAYWKMILWLHQDKLDSALGLLESRRGKWSGGLRRAHSEAFLYLAKKATENQMASHPINLEPHPKWTSEKSQQDRVETLQREAVELRAEVGRLQTERLKYQKLIKDLETIR